MISTLSTQTWQDVNGVPYVNGKLVFLKAGTQQASDKTFRDPELLYPCSEFTLDSRGTCKVYCPLGTQEDVYLYDSQDRIINFWPSYPMTTGSGSMTEVVTDETLTGKGTTASPLGADTDVMATRTFVDGRVSTYGIEMRPEGTNTLRFYRPDLWSQTLND